jgi:hypothetical protein
LGENSPLEILIAILRKSGGKEIIFFLLVKKEAHPKNAKL